MNRAHIIQSQNFYHILTNYASKENLLGNFWLILRQIFVIHKSLDLLEEGRVVDQKITFDHRGETGGGQSLADPKFRS